ncbi:hypothetical protein IJH97_00980 [Candidatus Saccharibacteria bacterium]|nr:hypothetical protein [Candidatus Saccharibacteria bacterium]
MGIKIVNLVLVLVILAILAAVLGATNVGIVKYRDGGRRIAHRRCGELPFLMLGTAGGILAGTMFSAFFYDILVEKMNALPGAEGATINADMTMKIFIFIFSATVAYILYYIARIAEDHHQIKLEQQL